MAQILSGQCYGFSKNFENFYPDRDLGSEGTFGGPITGVCTGVSRLLNGDVLGPGPITRR